MKFLSNYSVDEGKAADVWGSASTSPAAASMLPVTSLSRKLPSKVVRFVIANGESSTLITGTKDQRSKLHDSSLKGDLIWHGQRCHLLARLRTKGTANEVVGFGC